MKKWIVDVSYFSHGCPNVFGYRRKRYCSNADHPEYGGDSNDIDFGGKSPLCNFEQCPIKSSGLLETEDTE